MFEQLLLTQLAEVGSITWPRVGVQLPLSTSVNTTLAGRGRGALSLLLVWPSLTVKISKFKTLLLDSDSFRSRVLNHLLSIITDSWLITWNMMERSKKLFENRKWKWRKKKTWMAQQWVALRAPRGSLVTGSGHHFLLPYWSKPSPDAQLTIPWDEPHPGNQLHFTPMKNKIRFRHSGYSSCTVKESWDHRPDQKWC